MGQEFLVYIELLQDLFHQAAGVVGVVDSEVRSEAEPVAPAAQYARAGRVEGGRPDLVRALAAYGLDPVLELAGGLVGEGYREYLPRFGETRLDDIGYAVDEHGRLAGARAREDEQRPLGVEDRLALHVVHRAELSFDAVKIIHHTDLVKRIPDYCITHDPVYNSP